MIRTVSYISENPGPHLLVLGAVHGNETCGAVAIERVLAQFADGRLALKKGQVTFVPVCNPRAYQAGARFIERNLNRYLVPMAEPNSYEARLGNVLCPLLERCDVLIDIHSYTIGGPPFALVRDNITTQEKDLAACLGAEAIIFGWPEAFIASGRHVADASSEEGTGTSQYARRFGAIATTLECGQHQDPLAPEIAYHAIIRALAFLELTEAATSSPAPVAPPMVRMTHVFYRDDDGSFVKPWRNLEPVAKDEIIARTQDGQPVLSPGDGLILLPNATTPVGTEWFYIGVKA